MKKMVVVIAVLLVVVPLLGCVQMRDHVGERKAGEEGGIGIMHKRSFGEGQRAKKDYYVIQGGDGLVVGDTKDDVMRKMSAPDSIDRTIEGYETWVYSDKGVTFYFSGDHLINWEEEASR